MAQEVEIVGHFVGGNRHHVGAKALRKFFSVQLPLNLKEVQAVHGQLNYLVRFAP